MNFPIVQQLEEKLKGTPDRFLTILLFVVAAVAVGVALFAPSLVKAAVLAWLMLP